MRHAAPLALSVLAALALACGGGEPSVEVTAPVETPAQAAPPAKATKAPAPTSTATGPIKQTWEGLLAKDCDLKAVGVWTPVEARILRNTPFAMAGYTFKDISLKFVFQDDGGWYTPTTTEAPKLAADVSACVDKLKKHEDTLRRSIALPDELESRMTADHDLFVQLRAWGGGQGTSPYRDPRTSQNEEGTWNLWLAPADCVDDEDAGVECGAFWVSCPSETPCEHDVAG
ncbi:MAG: YARHG domain-containing protein [Alphaproteobacteria bacterium]|nr:YARHG domain-containing protein [Alphaproteobacteria bacterium]